jgi:hypothetical protein
MSLAYYGKTKKRQSWLLMFGLLALIAGTLAGLGEFSGGPGSPKSAAATTVASLIVQKVADPDGAAADATTFSGTANPGSPTSAPTLNWGPIAFGASQTISWSVSVTDVDLSEPSPGNGWTLVGFDLVASTAACSTDPDDYGSGNNIVSITTGQTKKVCVMNTKPKVATLKIEKVRDPNGSAADSTTFSGSANPAGGNNTENWGPIAFGAQATVSWTGSVTDIVMSESNPANGWTLVGFKLYTNAATACSTTASDYQSAAAIDQDVDIIGGATKKICVMNRKDAQTLNGNIQVHKYLPGPVNWQNQGNGQGAWTFSVYTTDPDGPNPTPAVATGNQLGSNIGPIPQVEIWVKETGTNGQTFVGWFVPDGDGTSGNDKCNLQPLDGSSLTTGTLRLPATIWQTKGNNTCLFHICAYNAPAKPTVTKTTADPAISGSKGFWNINIANTATGSVDYTVELVDTGATFEGVDSAANGSCTDSVGDGSPFTCTVKAGKTLVVKVSKPVSAAVKDGDVCKVSNSVTMNEVTGAKIADATGPKISIPTDYTGNPCAPGNPTITKTVADPALSGSKVFWNINVNNSVANAVSQTVALLDSGATFESVNNGTCLKNGNTAVAGDAMPVVCTVAANTTMVVKVSKPVSAAVKEGEVCKVPNSVEMRKSSTQRDRQCHGHQHHRPLGCGRHALQ